MSTPTCSNFFSKRNLASYENDRFLLTAHGPYIELYDLDIYLSDEFNTSEYIPIKTHVFDKNHVECCIVFKDSGHVLAVTSDHSSNRKMSVNACLIPRLQLLEGGYADTSCMHTLYAGYSSTQFSHAYSMNIITGTTEVLLLTDKILTHFRYSIEDGKDVVRDVIAQFDIDSLIPSHIYTNKLIFPLAVGNSSDYSIILSDDLSFILLKKEGRRWACRTMPKRGETHNILMIPGLEIAVIGGQHHPKFVSTRFRQSGVSSDQLRVLCAGKDGKTTRTLTCSNRDGITYVYVLEEGNLALWRIQNGQPIFERNFAHSSLHGERRLQDDKDIISHHRNHISSIRKAIKSSAPDIMNGNPISAIVFRKTLGDSELELLIISYESGDIKVLRTSDIIKNPICTYIPLGNKKMKLQSIFPCWNFPLSSNTPLNRLIGMSDGIPVTFELEKGAWKVTKQATIFIYSHVKSAVVLNVTISVFYNLHFICICTSDKDIRWTHANIANSKIQECFISSKYICVVTDSRILIIDILSFCCEVETPYVNASIKYESLGIESEGVEPLLVRSICVFTALQADLNKQETASICFQKGRIISIYLPTSTVTRGTSLEEIHDRVSTVDIHTHSKNGDAIIEMRTVLEGTFWLFENGVLRKYINGQNDWNNNINDYLRGAAKAEGFITIQTKEFNDNYTYVLARNGRELFLKDVGTVEDVTWEPIPSNFGDKPVFGHFVEPSAHGKCILYTLSTRKFGDIPELIRIEARVNHSRHRESLVFAGALFQPDTMVRFVPHKDRSLRHVVHLVCSYGSVIEVFELNGKGRMAFKTAINLLVEDRSALYIVSLDTYYVHSSNTLHIIAGSSTGEFCNILINLTTYQSTYGQSRMEESIEEIFFFRKEHPTHPPRLCFYLNETSLKIFEWLHDTKQTAKIHEIPLRTDGKKLKQKDFLDNRVHPICNGDDTDINDIWLVYNDEAVIHHGRKTDFRQNILKLPFTPWEGKVESIFLLSTRTSETTGIYSDFVFVVKQGCRIGILGTIQQLGQFPKSILFTELCTISNSISIAIHCELIECTVHAMNRIDACIRLFVAKRRSIIIYVIRLSIASGSLVVVENTKIGRISTSIIDPSYFVVSNMTPIPNRVTPKYGIVSGMEGTQTVRICEKKLWHKSLSKE